MIRLRLKFPNLRCTVQYGGKTLRWVDYAESKEELRERLCELRYTVVEIERYFFNDWCSRAEKETKIAVRLRNDPAYIYKTSLWKELKPLLFTLSKSKCAYCESEVKHISPGSVEHYRPKKRVEEDPDHPGYYWLAYDIDNYLPCCEECNGARGKRNHFPVRAGTRHARRPADVRRERPLLLNPFRDDPFRHLAFVGPDDTERFGELEGRTIVGKTSVLVYDLNRPALCRRRKNKFLEFQQRLKAAATDATIRTGILRRLRSGEEEYCIVMRDLFIEMLSDQLISERRQRLESEIRIASLETELRTLGSQLDGNSRPRTARQLRGRSSNRRARG